MANIIASVVRVIPLIAIIIVFQAIQALTIAHTATPTAKIPLLSQRKLATAYIALITKSIPLKAPLRKFIAFLLCSILSTNLPTPSTIFTRVGERFLISSTPNASHFDFRASVAPVRVFICFSANCLVIPEPLS